MNFAAYEYSRVLDSCRSSRIAGRSGTRHESVYRAFNREKSRCTRPLVSRVPRVMSGDRYVVLISADIPQLSVDFHSAFCVVTRNRVPSRTWRGPSRGRGVLLRSSFCASSFRARRAKSNRTWKVVMCVASCFVLIVHISVRSNCAMRLSVRALVR